MDPRPKILGLGADINSDLYGIWLPFFNRFLLVYHESEIIRKLQSILSSKVRAYVVPVHSAKNYQHTIIDNDVCLDWGLSPDFSKLLFGAESPKFQNFEIQPRPRCSNSMIGELHLFSIECLACLIKLKSFSQLSCQELYNMTDLHVELTLDYLPVLKYHEDSVSAQCQYTLNDKIKRLCQSRDDFNLHCEKAMYWATDVDDLDLIIRSFPQHNHITDIFLTRIYG